MRRDHGDWDEFVSSPIVLTGRGGSGTRLISEIARGLDIFLGNDLNISGDSVEWTDVIYSAAIQKLLFASMERSLQITEWNLRFNDCAHDLLRKGRGKSNDVWGWKLPETMIVLPEVFDAFPNAKLVHLVRHPVDVSLRRTHMTSRTSNPIGKAVLAAAYTHVGRDLGEIETDEDHIRNAISWLFQVETALDFAKTSLTPDRYLEVRYEDLCAEPRKVQSAVASFVERTRNPVCTLSIDPKRTRHFEFPDARIDQVWEICGELGEKLGYTPPVP